MNPSYSPTSGANKATAPKSDQNVKQVQVPRTHNPFTLTHTFLSTEDYGTYNPVTCLQVTPGDHIPLKVSNIIRSDSFNTPLLTPITKTFDTFMVPMFAILPNTWDYIYSNPTQGDDVPADANCFVPMFRDSILTIFNHVFTVLNGATSASVNNINSQRGWISLYVKWVFFLESILSSGSLLHRLGYKLTPRISKTSGSAQTYPYDTVDFLLDELLDHIAEYTTFSISRNNITKIFRVGTGVVGQSYGVTKHEYISLLREYCTSSSCVITPDDFDNAKTDILSTLTGLSLSIGSPLGSENLPYGENLNFGALIAYQLCCAQYYVNPSIDFLYNAELYRNAMYGLLKDAGVITLNNIDFERNGHTIKYDTFSSHFFKSALQLLETFTIASTSAAWSSSLSAPFNSVFAFFANIFSLQNTLRFGDYFTSSRPRPLAIGDSSAPVDADGNTVGGVDIVRAIAMARFLQACNKTSSDYTDQIKAMTGKDTPPDFHFPHFVSHDEIQLNSYEVSNTTSEALGDQVTRIDTASSVEPVILDIDLHGYIFVISGSYMPRTYCRTKFRHFFQEDRFDIFQEMLQNIGDQPVYQIERDDFFSTDTFGYQGRNEEYKQIYSHASGAFVDILKSWAFVSDSTYSLGYRVDNLFPISPDIIRCYSAEFDRFLPVDAYLSLGHHFHFINMYNIAIEANRPMMQSPSIL